MTLTDHLHDEVDHLEAMRAKVRELFDQARESLTLAHDNGPIDRAAYIAAMAKQMSDIAMALEGPMAAITTEALQGAAVLSRKRHHLP